MLHDNQGSIGIFGPFAYSIAATTVAANADADASRGSRHEAKVTGPLSHMRLAAESLFAGLQSLGAWIAQSLRERTA